MSRHFPTWLDVLAVLEDLGDHAVSRERVGARDARIWRWAVRARGPDGNDGPHPGPSPWLTFATGQRAPDVARLLPLWIADRYLRHVTADALAGEALCDPLQRRRYVVSRAVADFVLADPGQWRWLLDLVVAVDPDPLTSNDDEFDNEESLARRRHLETPARDLPRAPERPPPLHVDVAAPNGTSTRPTLWRKRDSI